MSCWVTIDDDDSNDALPDVNNDVNGGTSSNVGANSSDTTTSNNNINNNDNNSNIGNNNNVETEESDEAYQSRLSMNYNAALTDQSKGKPGTDVWENAKELYIETLEDSDPSIDSKAKRLIATAEVSASHGLTILHRLRYLCFKNLGKMYFKEKLFHEASKQFESALSVDPRDVMLWYDVAATFAKQAKYVDARYYLEKALTICPNHVLSLRRLCEILGPDGLDDTIGLKAIYNIIKTQELNLFQNTSNFYMANNASTQPFHCVLDGGWNMYYANNNNNNNKFFDSVIKANFEKNKTVLLSSDPWVVTGKDKHQMECESRDAFNEGGRVIVQETLHDITLVGLGVLLINVFEDLHSKKQHLINSVVEIETPHHERKTKEMGQTGHDIGNTLGTNNDNTNDVIMLNGSNVDADVIYSKSDCTTTSENSSSTSVLTTTTGKSRKKLHKSDHSSNIRTPENNTSDRIIAKKLTNDDDTKNNNKKRDRDVDKDSTDNDHSNLIVSNKKQKIIPKSRKLVKAGGNVSKVKDSKRAPSPKRISKRLKSQVNEPVIMAKPKPIVRDISESLGDVAFTKITELLPIDCKNHIKEDKQHKGATSKVANSILKQHGQYLTVLRIPITNANRASQMDVRESNNEMKEEESSAADLLNVNGQITKSKIQKVEHLQVLKLVDELNCLKVDINLLLQYFCRYLCVISSKKFEYKISNTLQNVQSTETQKRKLQINSISDVIVKIFALLTEFHKPLAFISLDTHTSADGLSKREASVTIKDRQKLVSKLNTLHTGAVKNICIGDGVETDALAWLTAAEIEIDQATKQKVNIHGGGSSEFYKRKAARNIQSSKRCLKEMWLALSKYTVEHSHIADNAKPSSMKVFLEKSKGTISQLDPEAQKTLYGRIRNGETYLKTLWEGRLRYYWLCAQLDKLNEKNAQSLFMLKCCAVTLNEKHVLKESSDILNESNRKSLKENGEVYYLNHCAHSNTIDHAGIVRRLDELASKSTIDKAISFYKVAVNLGSPSMEDEVVNSVAPNTGISMEIAVDATVNGNDHMDLEVNNTVPELDEEQIQEQRVGLFKKAIEELRNRYLPSMDSTDFDDNSWTCHYGELMDDFFNHQDGNNISKLGRNKDKSNTSLSRKRTRFVGKKKSGGNNKRRRRGLISQDTGEDAEVRPDLISIIVESCIESDNLILASKFLGRLMNEFAKPGRILDTAIDNINVLKKRGFSMSNTKDTAYNSIQKDKNPILHKKKQVIGRTREFCLHIINAMSNVAEACKAHNSASNTSSLEVCCWNIFQTVLPPYVHFAKLLHDKNIYKYISETAIIFRDESFALAFAWKMSKMYFDELYHGIEDFEKENPKSSSIISRGVSRSPRNAPASKRLTYKHGYEKYVQNDLLDDRLNHFDRNLVDMLQMAIEMGVACIRGNVFKQSTSIKVVADPTLANKNNKKLFCGFLGLALDVLDLAKKITSLRFTALNLFFTFVCALVPASFRVSCGDRDDLDAHIIDHKMMDNHHDFLRGVIESMHLQLGKWGLTTAYNGQILKQFVHVLTIMDKWNAVKGEVIPVYTPEIEDGDTDDEDENDVDSIKFTIDLLGKVYYDLFGFNIDLDFKTDSDYPPRSKYLSLHDPNLSNEEKKRRKQFCIDLFDFANERIQSKTNGGSPKDKRFIMSELHKVFHIDVWQCVLFPNDNYDNGMTSIVASNEIPYGKLVINVLRKNVNTNAVSNNDANDTEDISIENQIKTFLKEMRIKQEDVNKNINMKLKSGEELVRNEFYRLYANLMQPPGSNSNSNKDQDLYNFHRIRIEILLQDLSYNPDRIESWYDLGMSALVLLNNRIDATLDLVRNSMTKVNGNAGSGGNLQLTLDAFTGEHFDYYFVNRIKLHTIALHSFNVALALSKNTKQNSRIKLVDVYEQIGMIAYNDMRCLSRKPQLNVELYRQYGTDAFIAFEKANGELETWVYNFYLGKIALKLDREHANKEQSGLRKSLQRGLKYLRRAYDLRIVKGNGRPIEYTTYRLYATILKGVLHSHKLADDDVVDLLEKFAPEYHNHANANTKTSYPHIDKNIYLRRYQLLSFCIEKLKAIIQKSVSISDHRSRFMVAKALYYGKDILEAVVSNVYAKENTVYKAYIDKTYGAINVCDWGAAPALVHLRSYFASKAKKKKSRNSTNTDNASPLNPQKMKLNYYNQLVGLWFEHGVNKETTLFDLMERRHFKYNYLREKYIEFYIKLSEESLLLYEMGQYLLLLQKQSYDKKVLASGKTLIMYFLSYHILAMYRVIVVTNDTNKEQITTLNTKDAEEVLRIAYRVHLAAVTYGLKGKKKITDALIEAYDVYEKSANRGGGEAQATISEIINTLKDKFPIEDSNNSLVRAKGRLGRQGGGMGGLKLNKNVHS